MDRQDITWLARYSVRIVPAERREWAEAVWAEASEVPARGRLTWVAAGLWLVAKEAGMFRRISYWLGVAALAAGAAGVVALVWRGSPVAAGFRSVSLRAISMGDAGVYIDPHATEQYRTLAIATVVLLAALPWLARRRGVFGPVGDSVAARVVRVGGCGAICVLVLVFARLAQSLGEDLGAGAFSFPASLMVMGVTTAYLAAFAAVVAGRWAPRWYSRLGEEARTLIVLVAVVVGFGLFLFNSGWWLITAYLTGIFAVTARGSRIAPTTLVFGAGAGIAGGLIWYATVSTEGVFLHANPWLVPVVGVVVFAAPAASGAAAAWCTAGSDDPEAARRECWRQGLTAGALTGAAASLLITISVLGTMVTAHLQFGPHSTEIYLLVALFGPLLGSAMGIIGGSAAAEHRSGALQEGAPAPVPPAI